MDSSVPLVNPGEGWAWQRLIQSNMIGYKNDDSECQSKAAQGLRSCYAYIVFVLVTAIQGQGSDEIFEHCW